jgi:hypothetical protein
LSRNIETQRTRVGAQGGTGPHDRDEVYGLSSRGLLCLFNREHTIERYVNVKPETQPPPKQQQQQEEGGGCGGGGAGAGAGTGRAFALSVCARCVAVGCSGGIIRLFAPHTLRYITTLPKPAACGRQNVSRPITSGAADQEAADRRTAAAQDVFPDAVCVSLTDDGNFLTAIYSDHR